VADRDDIDKAVRLGVKLAHGPLMLLDYIGADTTLAIAEVLQRELNEKFQPHPGLKLMVRANLLGRKLGGASTTGHKGRVAVGV